MATRSRIGIERENGKIETIYCHWDGYIDGNGVILKNFYNRQQVEELLKLGDISSLHANPKSSLSYASRGEKDTEAIITDIQDDFNSDIEYTYIYTLDDEWIVSDHGDKYAPLQCNILCDIEKKEYLSQDIYKWE